MGLSSTTYFFCAFFLVCCTIVLIVQAIETGKTNPTVSHKTNGSVLKFWRTNVWGSVGKINTTEQCSERGHQCWLCAVSRKAKKRKEKENKINVRWQMEISSNMPFLFYLNFHTFPPEIPLNQESEIFFLNWFCAGSMPVLFLFFSSLTLIESTSTKSKALLLKQ